MRHRARSRKLGRTSAHRVALYRNLVTSLLDHERIQTTNAKAKELRRVADRMITLGKRGTLHARRRALRVIRRRQVAAKVFDELAERYRNRQGGYTRVVKLRNRRGDAAALSIVELVEADDVAKTKRAKAAGKAGSKKAAAAKGRAKKTEKAGSKKPAGEKGAAKKAAAAKGPSRKVKKAEAKKPASEKAPAKKAGKAGSKKAATKKKSGARAAKKSD